MKKHEYKLTVKWTGNKGEGTSHYTAYERSHLISSTNKPDILCSSDSAFRGDKTKYNPEEFLLAALSSCHMLQYLHLCADAGVVVIDYVDAASGTMTETSAGGGHFTEVTLHPMVIVSNKSSVQLAESLHTKANELCFIASSVNFPVNHISTIKAKHEI